MPTIGERATEIQRIQRQTSQQTLHETLEADLRSRVVKTVQTVLESALVEEVQFSLGSNQLSSGSNQLFLG